MNYESLMLLVHLVLAALLTGLTITFKYRQYLIEFPRIAPDTSSTFYARTWKILQIDELFSLRETASPRLIKDIT